MMRRWIMGCLLLSSAAIAQTATPTATPTVTMTPGVNERLKAHRRQCVTVPVTLGAACATTSEPPCNTDPVEIVWRVPFASVFQSTGCRVDPCIYNVQCLPIDPTPAPGVRVLAVSERSAIRARVVLFNRDPGVSRTITLQCCGQVMP